MILLSSLALASPSVPSPADVAPAIAEALGILDDTPLDLPKRARLACEGQPTLLVIDNFEHVLDMATLVVHLLTSVATLRVLVTSRAPLRVRGEREYAVGPLPMGDLDVSSPDDLAQMRPLLVGNRGPRAPARAGSCRHRPDRQA